MSEISPSRSAISSGPPSAQAPSNRRTWASLTMMPRSRAASSPAAFTMMNSTGTRTLAGSALMSRRYLVASNGAPRC